MFYQLDIWRSHQMFGMLIVSFLIPFLFYKRIGLTASLLWSYCLTYSCYVAFYPAPYKKPYVTDVLASMLTKGAAQAYCMTLAMPLVALFISRKVIDYLCYICVLNMIPVGVLGYGMFNVFSMDTTALAIAVIYLISKENIELASFQTLMASLGLTSIVFLGGQTSFISLAVGIFFILTARLSTKKILSLGFVLFLMLSLGLYLFPVLSLETRFLGWKSIMKWWASYGNVYWGMGPGSFEWLAPFIKLSTGEVFVWMHNDFLQYLFEYGIVGAVLMVSVLARSTFKSWKTYLFPTLATMYAGMFAYFPAHFFLSQFIMLLVLIESIDMKLKPLAIE